ncbi:Thyrotropin-releasing hormone receptor [Holothuria leucospilota]|uniref:Thyrotropin-releasing hormone receptor n=1 Tax=Holothuria leucospilota TaxID=206669 RepID=A0A9Q1BLD2_HOLLE|nr:Thyrotropin-releasing hormone receptor [Holothuria leucospilota]
MATGRNLSSCTPDMMYLNLTFLTADDIDYVFYSRKDQILITIILPILLAIGLTTNGAFLFVFARIRRMRTVTNIYLANLAVADMSFLCLAIGEKIGRYFASNIEIDQYGLGSAVGCEVIYCSMECLFYASIFLVLLVTLEKYYAICRPVRHRLIAGRKRTLRLITTSWFLAIICGYGLNLPYFFRFYYMCVEFPDLPEYADAYNVIAVCFGVSPIVMDILNGVRTIPFFVALIWNFVMYWKILKVFNMRVAAQPQSQQNTAASSQRVKTRNQVARMLIVNGIFFFFLLSPYQFLRIVVMITETIGRYLLDTRQYGIVVWVFRVMIYINSIINPIIYNLTNKKYRQAFAQALLCRDPRSKKTYPDQTDNTLEDQPNHTERETVAMQDSKGQ